MKLFIIALAALALAACPKQGDDGHNHDKHDHSVKSADKHEEAAEHKSPDEHAGHGHGENEASDLDRPVAELFGESCEHAIKTHACDECRYEVGVVKATKNLFEGGLLKTARPEKKAVSVPLSLTGEVRFDERRVAHVSTLVEGIIRKVHVMLGDKVKRGQALIEIESVAVGEAEAAYLEAQGMLKLARHNHDRLAVLRKEGISSEKELLVAKQELVAAKIRNDAALGKLTRLGMRAPAAGTVLEMHAVAGEVARSESSLVTVGDNSALWVWADLYEQDVALVMREQAKQALAAEVEVKAFSKVRFKGTVDFVSPAMTEKSRTVKLRIAVPNPTGRLLAGMFAGVKIFIPGDSEALTLPQCAVLEDDGRSFVFVHHEGEYYVRRWVVSGRSFAGLVEISSGLKGDEIVVTDGAFLMKSDVLRSKMGAGCAD
ncbi:MAG: efflux RND transporter periplasmic adaptor subunit [Deltaproteobacteria bacterium]|nr:efflux RND transporter periplasmic adaptor subunit [Deltaproteobacteria bacterium]